MKNTHGNVKCDCGHRQNDHHSNEGWCHSSNHKNPRQCGCTWFHPNVKYITRKKIENKIKTNNMKPYHLTILRDGKYETIFGEMTSIENFILIEKELGRDTHVLYSRELTDYDWKLFKRTKENKGNY